MKHLIYTLLLLFSFATVSYAANPTHDLTIVLPNVKNTSGKIQIGLFNKAENFPKPNKHYKTITLNAKKGLRYTFKDLPAGDYGLAIMHDENGNGKCDMNMLGIPKEGYGFSNNVKPKLSAPSFSQVKISLRQDKTISVNLIY